MSIDLTGKAITLSTGATTGAGQTLNYGGAADPNQGLSTDQDTIITTTVSANQLNTGDTVTINGVNFMVTSIEEYAATVTYDNGASSASGVPFVVVNVSDGGGGQQAIGIFANGATTYANTTEVTMDTAAGSGPVDETMISDSGVGTPIPDGAVDGLDTGESMGSGYVDAQGDQIDNSGNTINANGGDDTVYGGWGDDTISGGAGQDFVFGGDGNDRIFGNDGNDSLWGDAGNDTLFGNDGDDKLIGGAGDDLLTGGLGDDTLYGDGVFGDNGGNLPSDAPEAGAGNDTLSLDGGNDIAYGGSGDDVFQIYDGFGNHVIVGGETGETGGDTIDASALTGNVSVIYSGDEAGTIDNGTNITGFDEIENLNLGSGDDRVEIVTSTTGTVNGGPGFDTLVLPDPAPGDPAPSVNVLSTVDNGDGTFTYGGYVDFPDGSRMEFENFEEIICFTPGTLIDTLRGRVAVEDLVPGDKVLTRDNGYQPLAWVGSRDLSDAQMARCPQAAPIRIAAGALGANLPERDLVVSPRHRMLVSGARAELMFGEREVLVTAADLLGLPGVRQDAAVATRYIHVMCEAHEIIRAEGSWTESFQPAEAVVNALDAATRDELLGLFPALGALGFAAARPVLSGAEARMLFAA